MKSVWKVLVIVSFSLSAGELPFAKNTVVLGEGDTWINIMSNLEELQDTSTDRSIHYPLSKKEDFKQVPSTMKIWSSPDTNIESGVWFRVKLRNENPNENMYVLNDTYQAKLILFFLLDENGKILSEKKVGFGTDHKDSFLKFNSNSISFDLKYKEEVYLYLFLYSEGFQFPNFDIFIWKEQIYFEHYRTIYLYLYYGIAISIFFYNLFLFFSTKDKAYLHYCFYVLSVICFFFCYQQQVIFLPFAIVKNYGDYFIQIFAFFTIITMIKFALSFLNLKSIYKITFFLLESAVKILYIYLILLLFLRIFLKSDNFIINNFMLIMQPTILIIDLLITYLAISAWWNGYIRAKYFTIAWILYLFGLFYAFLINFLNLANIQLFASWGIGFLILTHMNMFLDSIEMLLLSFALGDRYNLIQQENERAKQALLEREIQLKEAEATKKKLELGMLKQTIQPHFLMNSLNTVLGLIRENPDKAGEFVSFLGMEIRTMLDVSSERLIPISSEFAICKSHLEIMRIRLERKFTWKTQDISEEEKIPPLLFQTLLENAFTHSKGYTGNIAFLVKKLICDPEKPFPSGNIEWIQDQTLQALKRIESVYEFYSIYDESYKANTNLSQSNYRTGEDGTGTLYIKSRLEESYGDNWSFSQGFEGKSWVVRIGVGK
ncbi:MAG TPA: 7TM diverse intracellular signaling domain-containing protein [Leptospiraceae bacterium]|nr:7TM diverse intracellular signaling domain-containing protein [Leptospiraceae bacterium]